MLFSTADMEKSVKGTCQDKHGDKDDSRTSKKRSVVVSSKHGAARGTNKETQVGLGNQSDKSQQSNPTQVSKLQSVPVMKRKCQKTVGADPKLPSVYSSSRDEKTEGAKDSPAYNLRSKIRRTEGQNASPIIQKRKPPIKDGSKDSSAAIQKREILKTELQKIRPPISSAPPNKNIGITKPSTISMAGHDMKNQPSSSQCEPFIIEPMYHIRWEGNGMENGSFGQNCGLCNKDLSHAAEYDDLEFNEDFPYEDDDEDDDDEYYDDPMPPLLPAVDVLSCGHAYHTECLQKRTPDEQSSDPQCVLCSGNGLKNNLVIPFF